MDLTAARHEDVLFLVARERIDSTNAAVFAEAVLDAIEETDRAVILDFGKLSYISSAGLEAVLKIARSLKNGGVKLALCSLSDQVMEVFRISGFDRLLVIRDTRAEARTATDV